MLTETTIDVMIGTIKSQYNKGFPLDSIYSYIGRCSMLLYDFFKRPDLILLLLAKVKNDVDFKKFRPVMPQEGRRLKYEYTCNCESCKAGVPCDEAFLDIAGRINELIRKSDFPANYPNF